MEPFDDENDDFFGSFPFDAHGLGSAGDEDTCFSSNPSAFLASVSLPSSTAVTHAPPPGTQQPHRLWHEGQAQETRGAAQKSDEDFSYPPMLFTPGVSSSPRPADLEYAPSSLTAREDSHATRSCSFKAETPPTATTMHPFAQQAQPIPAAPTLSLMASTDPISKMTLPPAPPIPCPRTMQMPRRSVSMGGPAVPVGIAPSHIHKPTQMNVDPILAPNVIVRNVSTIPFNVSKVSTFDSGASFKAFPVSQPSLGNLPKRGATVELLSGGNFQPPYNYQEGKDETEIPAKRPNVLNRGRLPLSRSITYPPMPGSIPTNVLDMSVQANSSDPRIENLLSDFQTQDLGETMEPGPQFCLQLHHYQKQALFWMCNRENVLKKAPTNPEDRGPVQINPSTFSFVSPQMSNRGPLVQISSGISQIEHYLSRGGILADEQGMGKTIQMIALMVTNPCKSRFPLRDSSVHIHSNGTLIVCPLTTMDQWAAEIRRATSDPGLSIYSYHSGTRKKDPVFLSQFDVVITTYSTLATEHAGYSAEDKNSFIPGNDTRHLNSIAPLEKIRWHRVILDEAHIIKDRTTRSAKAAASLEAECRWCVTGTPLQNKLDDIFSLIQFLRLEPYGRLGWWTQYITKPIRGQDMKGLTRLQNILQLILLRRTKDQKVHDQAIVSMSPKIVKIHRYTFDETEKLFYNSLWSSSRTKFESFSEAGTIFKNYSVILELLLRLRQACGHPLLCYARGGTPNVARTPNGGGGLDVQSPRMSFEKDMEMIGEQSLCQVCFESVDKLMIYPCEHWACLECFNPGDGCVLDCPVCSQQTHANRVVEKEVSQPCPTLPDSKVLPTEGFQASTKISALMRELHYIRQADRSIKSIVFSQWTGMLNLVEVALSDARLKYARLDGNMSQSQRETSIRQFKTDPSIPVILISLKAGGLGLNLPEASRVFMLDPWWNPAAEEQAIDRVHRLNQTKPVVVIRFIIQNSIEDKILELQDKKRLLAHGALSRNPAELRQLRLEDLRLLFS